MAASSTIKLTNTIEWARKLNFGRFMALGGISPLEPALTSANTVIQTICGAPFAWRWNRVVTGFICTAGQQDYTLTNWAATTAVKLGWLTVDDAGNCQQVTVAGTTGSGAPTWNHTLNATTTDGSVTWKNIGSIGVLVSQTYNMQWIETVSVQDINTSIPSPKWIEIDEKRCLGVDSVQGRPHSIAAQGDDGQGNITFRLMPVPDVAYPVAITLQQKAPLFNSIQQTWSPIPDEYSRIFNWGFLSQMLLFSDDPRFGTANQKFVAGLLGAAEGMTETERNIFLNNWHAVSGVQLEMAQRSSQGIQSRGV